MAIVDRVEKAYSLHLMGQSVRAISRSLSVSHKTIVDDLRRARELRREYHGASIEEKTQQRLDELNETIKQAWLAFLSTDAKSLNKSGYINALRGLYAEKSKIEGLYAPVKQELTGRDGGPLELAAVDWRQKFEQDLEQARLRLMEGGKGTETK